MASTQPSNVVESINPASVMPPVEDGDPTASDVLAQLHTLEREVLMRNSELQARLDAIEPDTRGLKKDTVAARDALDDLARTLEALRDQIGDTGTRTESLEAITRSLSESSELLSKLLDDAVARLSSRADHHDHRLAEDAERLEGLDKLSRGLDRQIAEVDSRLKDTIESVATADERHNAHYERLNSALASAADKLKSMDQHQEGQITGLADRLGRLEPGHEALRNDVEGLAGRLDTLEPRQAALKSAHNTLAVHVSDLDIKTDRTDKRLYRGAWVAGMVAVVIAVAAGSALWNGYHNRGALMDAISKQAEWARAETANLWTSVTALGQHTAAVEDRVTDLGGRVNAVDTRVDDFATTTEDMTGRVSTIEARIYASDTALDGAPVDMATVKGEDWLATQPGDNYVVQLLGSYSPRSLASLMARYRDTLDLGRFSYIKTTHNGRDWFVLLYGSYGDFAAAMATLEGLPQRLHRSGPYVRTVAGALSSAARS